MNERERIEHIVEMYGLTPSQFADKTGIPRASVSHILGGRNKPSLEVLQKVCMTFPEINTNWLMLGIGDAPQKRITEPALEAEERTPQHEASLFSEIPVIPTTANYTPAAATQHNEEQLQPTRTRSKVVKAATPMPTRVQSTEQRVQRKNVQHRNTTAAQESNSRQIKEIRVFYTDGTYEILYPEK